MTTPKRTAQEINTDPKFEGERNEFDSLVEASVKRIAERKQKNTPAPDPNKAEGGFLDGLFEGLFGSKSE